MRRDEFRRAVPETPQHFIQRMDETIERIEKMNKHTAKRSMGILLAAALLILAMAGAAAAATNIFGLLDYASSGENGPKPLESAKDLIQDEFEGGWICENGTVQVRETIYTGKTYSILLHTSFETMFPEWRLLNAEKGAETLDYSATEEGMDFVLGGTVNGDAPHTLEVELVIPQYRDREVLKPLVIQISLEQAGGETAKLRPLNACESWSLVEAKWTNNPYISSLEVVYKCDRAGDYDMGVDIILMDAAGNRVATGAGNMEQVVLEDGTIAYRCCQEVQSFDEWPESVMLQPKVVGEDTWLERIECEVVAG